MTLIPEMLLQFKLSFKFKTDNNDGQAGKQRKREINM